MSASPFSEVERRAAAAGWKAARAFENKYGEFQSIIDCESEIADGIHDFLAECGQVDEVEGDIFWELATLLAGYFYAGDSLREALS